MPQGVANFTLPAYVRSTYGLVSEQFRCWHFDHCMDSEKPEFVRCLFSLALVCPNFDYSRLRNHRKEVFKSTLHRVIGYAEFKEHAPRLQRFLF
ncbi:hypothetical protein IWW38_001967, partial [Coemansia aciculifera]